MHRTGRILLPRLLGGLLCFVFSTIAAAADKTAWPTPDWQVDKPENQYMSAAGLDKVRDWLKDSGAKAGLVVRHGRIVGEWYWEGAEPSTKHVVYSTTKSFASTAAGLVIADGKLSLDTKVGELLPDVSPAEKREVTVRQILSMTTGVHNDNKINTYPDPFNYVLTRAPMDFKPGEKWDYNNTGLSLLSPVIHKATGKEIDAVLAEKIFEPIGINSSDWSWEHKDGHAIPYSSLRITARALARFGLVILNGGKWQDRQLVPAAWVAEATGPSQDLNKSYGYLWWNNTTNKWPGVPNSAFSALGRFDNDMFIAPSLNMIVIRQIGDDDNPKRKVAIGELFRLAVEAADSGRAQ